MERQPSSAAVTAVTCTCLVIGAAFVIFGGLLGSRFEAGLMHGMAVAFFLVSWSLMRSLLGRSPLTLLLLPFLDVAHWLGSLWARPYRPNPFANAVDSLEFTHPEPVEATAHEE